MSEIADEDDICAGLLSNFTTAQRSYMLHFYVVIQMLKSVQVKVQQQQQQHIIKRHSGGRSALDVCVRA
jgi:hypothetical protein